MNCQIAKNSPNPHFGELRIYATPNAVNLDAPIQLHYDDSQWYSKHKDLVMLMHHFPSEHLNRDEALAKLTDEIKAFNEGGNDIYPENLRQRIIKIIKSIKPSTLNTTLKEGYTGSPTAWDVLSAQRDKLIDLLKNPEYVFKKTSYGFLFCPKSRQLSKFGT
jgi:hypothetical protein